MTATMVMHLTSGPTMMETAASLEFCQEIRPQQLPGAKKTQKKGADKQELLAPPRKTRKLL
jgi:hypothetical protein